MVLAYTPATDTWEQVTTLPASRYLHAILTYDNKTVLASGYVNGSPSGRVDIYDYTKNNWVQANSLPARTVEMPVAEYKNSIYVIGGRHDGNINNLPMYADVYEGVLITEGNFTPEVYISLLDSSAVAGTRFNYVIPTFTFIDDDTLTYSARLITGEALPEWLTLNSKTGNFSGKPMISGTLEIIVTATDNYNASVVDTFIISVSSTSALADINAEKIKVYPNPASQNIQIIGNGLLLNKATYKLINLNGKTIMHGKLNSEIIDISELPKGIYMLSLQNYEGIFTNKIVVE
jgi:Putative Ig domain/Secretion system C-terminal sorting domain/Kelch motif